MSREVETAAWWRVTDLLTCPCCGGGLTGGEETLSCALCGSVFPVEAGMPLLTPRDRRFACPKCGRAVLPADSQGRRPHGPCLDCR